MNTKELVRIGSRLLAEQCGGAAYTSMVDFTVALLLNRKLLPAKLFTATAWAMAGTVPATLYVYLEAPRRSS